MIYCGFRDSWVVKHSYFCSALSWLFLKMLSWAGRKHLKSVAGRGLRCSHSARPSTFLHSQEHRQKVFVGGYVVLSSALLALAAVTADAADADNASNKSITEYPLKEETFSTIIVGGGTAGCTVAYLTAKWMQDNNIPGNVLLLDRGVDFFDAKNGPSPAIKQWFTNWGSFGEAHPAEREDGSLYPVTGSDHKGVGGCGTHDTRITFQVLPETVARYAELMGWTEEQVLAYYQAALNLMPISRSIPKDTPEQFYETILNNLPNDIANLADEGNEHQTRLSLDSVAEFSVACYPNELRWTSAYLLHDSVRPSNLTVLSNAVVDKVVLEKVNNQVVAKGVVIQVGEGGERKEVVARLEEHGEVALTGGAFGAVSVLQRSGVGPRAVLEAAGIAEVFVDNPEVGHGVDHPEISVMYEWLDKWNLSDTELPRGGVMGWPFGAFFNFLPEHANLLTEDPEQKNRNTFTMGHFGAGLCEPYTDFPTVVCTPNCPRPDLRAGYRAQITSTDPAQSLRVIHTEQRQDWETMAQGVYATVRMFEYLQSRGVVGKRLEPSFDLSPSNSEELVQWIRENHFTVFHWACTCKAGVNGAVADARFRVRNPSPAIPEGVVANLRVGSAACLPDMPDANPHLTITAFSFALAEELARTQATRKQKEFSSPGELRQAALDLDSRAASLADKFSRAELVAQQKLLQIRRAGEEQPNLYEVATQHYEKWLKEHSDNEGGC